MWWWLRLLWLEMRLFFLKAKYWWWGSLPSRWTMKVGIILAALEATIVICLPIFVFRIVVEAESGRVERVFRGGNFRRIGEFMSINGPYDLVDIRWWYAWSPHRVRVILDEADES